MDVLFPNGLVVGFCQVDVFASGILVYFMLYRALPFWSDDHEEMLSKTRACEARIAAPQIDRENQSINEVMKKNVATFLGEQTVGFVWHDSCQV